MKIDIIQNFKWDLHKKVAEYWNLETCLNSMLGSQSPRGQVMYYFSILGIHTTARPRLVRIMGPKFLKNRTNRKSHYKG